MRRTPFFTLLTLVSLLGFVPSVSRAGLIYDIANYPDGQAGYQVSGTITTDGALGSISKSDILSWQVLVSLSGTTVFTMSSSDSGAFTNISNLTASSTSLSISSVAGSTGAFGLFDTPPQSGTSDVNFTAYPGGIIEIGGQVGGEVGGQAQGRELWTSRPAALQGDSVVVATAATAAVPEPSGVILALLGIVGTTCAFFIQRRRAVV